MAGVVRIRGEIVERMLEEARQSPGTECCGLLAGRDGVISVILPAANALASATTYEIAPQELFRMFRFLREAGLEHMGIYHSHVAGPGVPSATDIERAYYPDVAYFIVALEAEAAGRVGAFSIRDGVVVELTIEVS